MNYINIAKRVIVQGSQALNVLSQNIPEDFTKVVEYIIAFKGRLAITGIGKSGYIAHKLAASFASTGTPAFYIHPAEASHGDLGMITLNDLVIILSNSGETKELLDIINYCKRFSIKIIGITMDQSSTVAQSSDFLLRIPTMNEASTIAAPTISTSMMLSIGDALVTAVHEARGFSKNDFKVYHPGGTIGAMHIR